MSTETKELEAALEVEVHGSRVAIITRLEDGEAVEIVICHDLLSAINALEARLAEDAESLSDLVRQLETTNGIPCLLPESSVFFVPDALLARFNELLAFGVAVCEAAESDDPGAVLLELLEEKSIFYAFVSADPETSEVAILALFIDAEGATCGVVLFDQVQASELLRELVTVVDSETVQRLSAAFSSLPLTSENASYRFANNLSNTLLVGRAAEVRMTQNAREKPLLQ